MGAGSFKVRSMKYTLLLSLCFLVACGEAGLRIETGAGTTTQSTPSYDVRTSIDFEYTRAGLGYTKFQDEQRFSFTKPADARMYDRRYSVDFIYWNGIQKDFPLEMTISNVKTRIKVPTAGSSTVPAVTQPEPAVVNLRFSFRNPKVDLTKPILCTSDLAPIGISKVDEEGCKFDVSSAAFRMNIPGEHVTCRLRISSEANLDFTTMPVGSSGMTQVSFPSSLQADTLTGKSFAISVFCHRSGTKVLMGQFLHNAYVAPY